MSKRTCKHCGETKPEAAFRKLAGRDCYLGRCRACLADQNRDYARMHRLGKVAEYRGDHRVRHNQINPELLRAARSKDPTKRPHCPCCARVAPGLAAGEWLLAWGHRCPHGEPCPGWSAVPAGAKQCAQCNPAMPAQPEVRA
jgi:hypothetical protein